MKPGRVSQAKMVLRVGLGNGRGAPERPTMPEENQSEVRSCAGVENSMGRCSTKEKGNLFRSGRRAGKRAFGAEGESVAGRREGGKGRRGQEGRGERWGKKGSGGSVTSGSEEGRRRQRSQKRGHSRADRLMVPGVLRETGRKWGQSREATTSNSSASAPKHRPPQPGARQTRRRST